jgi:hypothetical protein
VSGLSEEQVQTLQQLVIEQARHLTGEVMIFELTTFVQQYITYEPIESL